MISKTIHYIWLSDDPMDESAKLCQRSWKRKATGYTIRRWSMADFDFSAMPLWVTQAMEMKKWAFVCDYLRLVILYREGGFYLDSDVLMLRSPDRFLHHRFVSAVEYAPDTFREYGSKQVDAQGNAAEKNIIGMGFQAAIMGSEAGHPFLKMCMEYYETTPFLLPDGSMNISMLAPTIYALAARKFGFVYKNQLQNLQEGMVIYPYHILAPYCTDCARDSVMVHLVTGSWLNLNDSTRNSIQKRNIHYIQNAQIKTGDLRTILQVIPRRIVKRIFVLLRLMKY